MIFMSQSSCYISWSVRTAIQGSSPKRKPRKSIKQNSTALTTTNKRCCSFKLFTNLDVSCFKNIPSKRPGPKTIGKQKNARIIIAPFSVPGFLLEATIAPYPAPYIAATEKRNATAKSIQQPGPFIEIPKIFFCDNVVFFKVHKSFAI
jgi:hypothetical protein